VCVCVTLLHIPTMRRHGVARVHPSVSVFPSVSLRRAISALLPDPLDTVRAFPDLSAGCLSVCLSVCLQLAFKNCQWHNNAAVTDTLHS